MRQFGGKLTRDLIARYEQSPNWRDGSFQNLMETKMDLGIGKIPGLLYKQIFDRKGRDPKSLLPIEPFNPEKWKSSTETQIIWYGHSVVLLKVNGQNILIDPMLGPNAAPIAPFAVKRYSENTLDLIDSLPEIDLMLLTHDHYDHLDLASMKKLIPKVNRYFVALGSARHLIDWGVERSIVQEFDWWDEAVFNSIKITFTPSRHFSGRGLKDRAKSLWGGWVIDSNAERLYWSGDGGYGEHFKEVGEKLGPFDFGFMECGQYNELWHAIHMYPEESVNAAIDARVKKAMAVHWGGFSLALHTWKDPIERFTKEASRLELEVTNPKLGQQFSLHDEIKEHWWDNFE